MITSRSAIETYLSNCQYAYWLNYARPNPAPMIALGGPEAPNVVAPPSGLQPTKKSIDLECGQATHSAIEHLFKGSSLEEALAVADGYMASKADSIFDHKINNDDEGMVAYSVEEHRALIESMIYVWYLSEFQWIKDKYQIVASEKELRNPLVKYSPDSTTATHWLASRVDALLWHKELQTYTTYSLKTTKQLGWFTDATSNTDLQGYLEMWATNQFLSQLAGYKEKTLSEAQAFGVEHASTIEKYLDKKFPKGNAVADIRFCYLVKGDRRRKPSEPDTAYPKRDNPLIYGWRKANAPVMPKANKRGQFTEEEIELASKVVEPWSYAHSFEFSNPDNPSGVGKLGKGWEKFPVWREYAGGVRKWIDDIQAGINQPEANNPLPARIKSEAITRDDFQMELTLDYVRRAIAEMVRKAEQGSEAFLPNTRSCSIPVSCDFRLCCPYSGEGNLELIANPLATLEPGTPPLYQIRVPHHPEGEKF